jgi:hypothetical protein
MDYRCLNACTSQGKGSTVCMAQCTYGQTQPAPKSPAGISAKSPHDQFSAPVPSNAILFKPRTVAAPTKDYNCISTCQQQNFQYEFCNEQCTNSTLPSNVINSGGSALTTANPSSLINARPSGAGAAR